MNADNPLWQAEGAIYHQHATHPTSATLDAFIAANVALRLHGLIRAETLPARIEWARRMLLNRA